MKQLSTIAAVVVVVATTASVVLAAGGNDVISQANQCNSSAKCKPNPSLCTQECTWSTKEEYALYSICANACIAQDNNTARSSNLVRRDATCNLNCVKDNMPNFWAKIKAADASEEQARATSPSASQDTSTPQVKPTTTVATTIRVTNIATQTVTDNARPTTSPTMATAAKTLQAESETKTTSQSQATPSSPSDEAMEVLYPLSMSPGSPSSSSSSSRSFGISIGLVVLGFAFVQL
ncbi:hypothetical protein H4R33_005980 [Dimargaris cristalligena]|nr:hypothetical protein H4R33_005980 [Dimargaris cristalligena]